MLAPGASVRPARLHAACLVRPPRPGGTGQLAPPTIVCQPLRAARTASVPPQVCYMPFASMARGEGAQAVGAVATTGAMAEDATPTAETSEAATAARVVCKVRASA